MPRAYHEYPFVVPLKARFFNLFRYLFTLPILEGLLLKKLAASPASRFWNKAIPHLYLYRPGSIRFANRGRISYQLDISRMMDHSLYFHRLRDRGWENLFSLLKDDFNIIDAGANIGYLTLQFARLCPRGMVYSFEPDSKNFQDLVNNVQQNAFGNIQLFQKALGAVAGTATMYSLYRMNPGTNRILATPPEQAIGSEIVEVVALDSLEATNQFNKIDLIKIDVEGFEAFVLQGAEQLIRKMKPLLYVELSEENLQQQGWSCAALVAYIESLGYRVVDAETMLPIDPHRGTVSDIVCFMDDGINP